MTNWAETKKILAAGLPSEKSKLIDKLVRNTRREREKQRAASRTLVTPADHGWLYEFAWFPTRTREGLVWLAPYWCKGPALEDLNKIVLPLIRKVMPSVIANEIIGVQPMTGPTAQIMTMKVRYGGWGDKIVRYRFAWLPTRLEPQKLFRTSWTWFQPYWEYGRIEARPTKNGGTASMVVATKRLLDSHTSTGRE